MAQSIGLAPDSPERLTAAVKHVLAASRQFGHCYLKLSQILDVARRIASMCTVRQVDIQRVKNGMERYCRSRATCLSREQAAAVTGIVAQQFSILTGGPGCGKTTTTLLLVRLLEAMGRRVLLAAPTGRPNCAPVKYDGACLLINAQIIAPLGAFLVACWPMERSSLPARMVENNFFSA